MKLYKKHRSAFTLIELLVVIAIIAILAAILFPVFAQAKEAAKKAADISNNKQVLLGTIMYMGDSEDVYPLLRWGQPHWGCNNGPGGSAVDCIEVNNGANSINPYVKNRDIWKAPNDSIARDDQPSAGAVNNTGGALSYTYNYYGLVTNSGGVRSPYALGMVGWTTNSAATGNESTTGTHSLNEGQVGQPADTVLIYPYYADFSYYYGQQAYCIDQRRVVFSDPAIYGLDLWPDENVGYAGWDSTDYLAIGGYAKKTNIGWADGHVKSVDRSSLMDINWDTNPALALQNHLRNKMAYDGAYHTN